MDRCKGVLVCFKEFTRGTASSATSHTLAVVRSLYPSVELDVIDGGFARGTTEAQIEALDGEATESVTKLAYDLNLFGDEGNRAE